MDYTTQMDAARKGIVTPQMKIVAEKEHMPVEKLMALVASGKVAIPANKSIPACRRKLSARTAARKSMSTSAFLRNTTTMKKNCRKSRMPST